MKIKNNPPDFSNCKYVCIYKKNGLLFQKRRDSKSIEPTKAGSQHHKKWPVLVSLCYVSMTIWRTTLVPRLAFKNIIQPKLPIVCMISMQLANKNYRNENTNSLNLHWYTLNLISVKCGSLYLTAWGNINDLVVNL